MFEVSQNAEREVQVSQMSWKRASRKQGMTSQMILDDYDDRARKRLQEEDRMQLIAFYYHKLQFTLIPLDPLTGKPLVQWAKYQIQNAKPSWEETAKWFNENDNGIAVVLGAASDFTFCLDEDKVGLLMEILHGNLNSLNTFIQKSPSGKYHLFLKDRACQISIARFADESGTVVCELKGNRHLITLAPSLHRELHQPYTNFSPKLAVREIHDVMSLLVNRIQQLGYKSIGLVSSYYANSDRPIAAGSLCLNNLEMNTLVDALSQLWYKGQHHAWIVATTGWLLSLGIAFEEASDFVTTLSRQLGCPKRCWVEAERQVKDLYRTASRPNSHIPAFSSLLEIARTHGRGDLVNQMLGLNKRFKHNKEIKMLARSWLAEKTNYEKQEES